MTDGYFVRQTFKLMETNICFVGHSHVAGVFTKDKEGNLNYSEDEKIAIKDENKYIINVGSVGQPRDNDPGAAYCIYDTEKKIVQIKRIDYDIKTARKKIIDIGLPQFLADRLLWGR